MLKVVITLPTFNLSGRNTRIYLSLQMRALIQFRAHSTFSLHRYVSVNLPVLFKQLRITVDKR